MLLLENIAKKCADDFGVTVLALKGRSKFMEIQRPRMAFCFISALSGYGWSEIGRYLNLPNSGYKLRTHATCKSNSNSCQDLISSNRQYREDIEKIIDDMELRCAYDSLNGNYITMYNLQVIIDNCKK